ncbi:MAG TPA: DUF2971 domain-containing protein [Burkholderiales bacterium]
MSELPKLPLSYRDIDGWEYFAVEPPEWLYHYTTLTNAGHIFKSKSLWLTKIQYLNDETELKIAITCFRRAIEAAIEIEPDEGKRELYRRTADQVDSFEQTNICVGSFCDSGDLLSQWRSYGSSGGGVALGFRGARLSEIQKRGYLNVWRCVYDPEKQNRLAQGLVRQLARSYDLLRAHAGGELSEQLKTALIERFSTTFLRVAPVFKNEHFAEEREWRVVTVPMKSDDPNYRAIVSDEWVAQVYILTFDPPPGRKHDFIGRVTIGPTTSPERVCSTLKIFAMKEDFEPIECSKSAIPFRG